VVSLGRTGEGLGLDRDIGQSRVEKMRVLLCSWEKVIDGRLHAASVEEFRTTSLFKYSLRSCTY